MAAAVTPAPASHKVSGRWQDPHRKIDESPIQRFIFSGVNVTSMFWCPRRFSSVLIRYLEAMAGYIN